MPFLFWAGRLGSVGKRRGENGGRVSKMKEKVECGGVEVSLLSG